MLKTHHHISIVLLHFAITFLCSWGYLCLLNQYTSNAIEQCLLLISSQLSEGTAVTGNRST